MRPRSSSKRSGCREGSSCGGSHFRRAWCYVSVRSHAWGRVRSVKGVWSSDSRGRCGQDRRATFKSQPLLPAPAMQTQHDQQQQQRS